jgi:drug/metabolite transporter (DMT)-like permease
MMVIAGLKSAGKQMHPTSSDHSRRISSADWPLVIIPGVIWGASFLFIAEGLRSVGPNGISFLRIATGFLTLSFFPASRRRVEAPGWTGIFALSVLWFAFPFSMFPFAEQRVSSALTGMLNTATPLFVTIVATFIAKRMPPARIMLGLFTGIGGSVLISLPSIQEGRSSAIGVVLVLLATLSYGFALNIARPLQQRYGALPVIWRGLGIATLLTAPFGFPEVQAANWSIIPVLSLIALGVFGTGIAIVILTVATGKLGATYASGSAFMMPPVALLLGVLIRRESVSPTSIIGGAICIAGAWIIRPRPNPETGASEHEAPANLPQDDQFAAPSPEMK